MSAVTAWHYTRGEKMMSIAVSGTLRPATAGIGPHEKPVVWFSLSQEFEPTALPGIVNQHGDRRSATLQEAFTLGRGLYRLGIDPGALLSDDALRKAARIGSSAWARLERAGRDVGADPANWLGHVGELSITALRLQRLTSIGGAWIEHAASDGVAP